MISFGLGMVIFVGIPLVPDPRPDRIFIGQLEEDSGLGSDLSNGRKSSKFYSIFGVTLSIQHLFGYLHILVHIYASTT